MLIPLLAVAAMAAPAAPATVASSAPTDLSVLSYNAHGVPWPIARHRKGALRQIGQSLAAMRANGDQPNIVLLQEAFTKPAKRIAALGDYRYAVAGPTRHDRMGAVRNPLTRLFTAREHRGKGEHDGTIEDSGLLVLSDYPIVDVKRMPYPRFACAGFDCLANKGVVLVRVQIPGSAELVTIIDTHMNSRGASGVAERRTG